MDVSKNLLNSPFRWVCGKAGRPGFIRRSSALFDLTREEIADIKRIAEGLQPDECRLYITSTGHEVMINPPDRVPEDDDAVLEYHPSPSDKDERRHSSEKAEKGFVAYIADPAPVPGVFDCPEDALAAAREMLPEGNAVGHVVEVGTTDPACRRRLYCLTADGTWREIIR